MLDRLTIPIIQAPMLSATTEAIAIAVSQTGALGSFAAAGSSPEKLAQSVAAIRAATDRPFAVNMFILPDTRPDPAVVQAAMDVIPPWRAQYGLPAQAIPNAWAEPFGPQFQALLEAAAPAASFTFGILTRDQAQALKARGTFVIGTATTVAEARAWAESGGRRHLRAGARGRRTSRHLPGGSRREFDRHAVARANHPGSHRPAGDRGGRHHGRGGRRRCAGARGGRRAGRHRLPAVRRSHHQPGLAPRHRDCAG